MGIRDDLLEAKPPFRYISESKISMLEKRNASFKNASASMFGTGIGIGIDHAPSISSRLNAVLSILKKDRMVSDLSGEGNFLKVTGKFVETSLMGVALWVAIREDTVLLLGGSTRYLEFHGGHQTEQATGSNRSEILRALTTLWRARIGQKNNLILDTQFPIESFDQCELWGGKALSRVCDDIPYPKATIDLPLNIQQYFEYTTRVYYLFDDAFVDNLNCVAIVFTDYRFPTNFKSNLFRSDFRGKRFVIGSPIYVPQVLPSGS